MSHKFFLIIAVIARIFKEYRLRSALSILGVAFGTFALITMVSVSYSLKEKSRLEVEKFGKNLVVVKSGKIRVFRRHSRSITTAKTLKISDALAIKQQIDHVVKVLPSFHISYPIRRKGTTIFSTIIGVGREYPEIRNINVEEGRFYTEKEEKTGEKVIVLGYKIARDFFGKEDPVGKTILIFRVPCKVIGVMEEKGSDVSGEDQDILIYTPLKTAMRRLANVDYINTIYIQVDKKENIPFVKRKIRELLRKRHHIKKGEKDDFTVLSPDDYLRMETEAIHIFSILGGVSAAISFIIGGIGILSIMILIVNERIEEIGIRRAVGAKKSDILLQFLLESAFISISGGLSGAILGTFLSVLIFSVFSLPYTLSLQWIIFSFSLSVLTGILAGLYPAVRASGIKPVEALRRT
ncbi:putative ABC transport system permease protein [Persephonella hydrogeniphila]|uniref:Putative ABC transport system permease protein n=1 Tax=Persephonella hydrogeniphila TaxID=198703 RepID=A0A285N4V2_9AQUI|nr:ABC transporter permease [Persephonella hydrogeniphila]SNZ03973.1 putative ABC transport system permease protein [Persephonella hydrogeniphila]